VKAMHLTPGDTVSGMVRLMGCQEQGWVYIKP
jgi:hypothetical protein